MVCRNTVLPLLATRWRWSLMKIFLSHREWQLLRQRTPVLLLCHPVKLSIHFFLSTSVCLSLCQIICAVRCLSFNSTLTAISNPASNKAERSRSPQASGNFTAAVALTLFRLNPLTHTHTHIWKPCIITMAGGGSLKDDHHLCPGSPAVTWHQEVLITWRSDQSRICEDPVRRNPYANL